MTILDILFRARKPAISAGYTAKSLPCEPMLLPIRSQESIPRSAVDWAKDSRIRSVFPECSTLSMHQTQRVLEAWGVPNALSGEVYRRLAGQYQGGH